MNSDGDGTTCMHALITGANSGLGFAICCRLIDEFLSARPATESLHLIFTTRDSHKSAATLARLHQHLNHSSPNARHRIYLHPEKVDLNSLNSVKALAQRLLTSLHVPKLDSIILNAGIGGFTGINWPAAIWGVVKNPLFAVTYPNYKLSAIGVTANPQQPLATTVVPIPDDTQTPTHPPLGEVFCANVFGHYMLAHFLAPLLLRASPKHGRIIWISSIEAVARTFSIADLQGLSSPQAYESSKRLTDILALTSSLPSTQPFVSRFSSPNHNPSQFLPSNPPKIYLAHPGICATSIVPLHFIPYYCMILLFYIARWFGSPWHNVQAYLGACAPVWLALALQDELDVMDNRGQQCKTKWGSSTDRGGRERVRRTEVEGFIYSGNRKSNSDRNEKDGEVKVSEEFEELGRSCWMQMEALREEWEERLGFSNPASSLSPPPPPPPPSE